MDKKTKVLNVCIIGVLTAFICVLAPLSVPIGSVPISLTPMGIYLIVYLVGGVKGTICVTIYLLIGIAGLPVFSGFGSGIGKLAGPTGGYIVGFLFEAAICGVALYFGKGKIYWYIPGMILGTLVLYLFGSAWFMISLHANFKATMKVCVLPFLPFDAAKIAIVAIVAPLIKKPLRRIPNMNGVLRF